MKRSIRNKCIAVGNSVLLLVQSLFSPWVGILLAATPNVPVANLSYTKESNEIHLTVSTKNTVEYVLSYRLASGKIDGAQGKDKQNPEFTKTIFVGTCSSDSCIGRRPEKGIAKYSVEQDSWTYRQLFIVENGSLQIISEGPTDAVTLSDDEMKWLESPDKSPPITPTPIPPTPTSAAKEILQQSLLQNSSLLQMITLSDPECRNDADGANDEPGQKDLNRLCRDQASNDPLNISWNWDEIQMSGSNTADACALFDTDAVGTIGYGFADYSLCATWEKNGQQLATSPVLYSCSDTRTDRCSGSAIASISHGTTCSISTVSDDPFPGPAAKDTGDAYPNDVQAQCAINMDDVGGASRANLLDVCSYPSVQPNSDPSDCILISSNKGNLEVVKNVTPDDSTTNWDISVVGPTVITKTLTGDSSSGIQTVSTGNYTVTESGGINTDLSQYNSSYSCSKNGSSYLSGTGATISGISIGAGDVVICTFVNTKKTGHIIVDKITDPSGAPDSFSFTTSGNGYSGFSLTDSSQPNDQILYPGRYSVSETIPSGWELTNVECVSSLGGTEAHDSLNLDANETITCTFSNKKLNPSLDLIKSSTTSAIIEVGQKIPYIFTVKNTGNQALTGITVSDPLCDTAPVYESGDLNSDGSLQTTEQWVYSCVHTVIQNEVAAGNSIVNTATADSKESDPATDTLTIPVTVGKIIIEKQTLPDGSGQSFEFAPSWNASHFYLKDGQTNDSGWLPPGTYSISEIVPSGWDLTRAVCSDASSISAISLSSGETVTCTFTNTQRSSLTIRKNTVGGNGTFQFTSATLPDANFSITTSGLTGSKNYTNLLPGTYDVTEIIPEGWVLSPSLSCVDPDGGTTVNTKTGLSTIDLDPGESITCTYTNMKLPKLTVIKHVINDNGGTKQAGDFTIRVSGSSLPTPSSFAGSESGTVVSFTNPTGGIYSVDEDTVNGYAKTIGSGCSGTITWGDDKTCTITNDDIAPTLTLVKSVTNDNGGTATPDQFTLSAVADNQSYPYVKGYGPIVSGTIRANTLYHLAESGVSGYTAGSWICSTTGATPVSSISALPGEKVTCSITNDDQAGTLIVKKVVKNDNGGTLTADDFTFSVNGGAQIPFEADGQNEITVNAGTYSITEPAVAGYTTTYNTCSQVYVPNGGSATCTITNDDIAPILRLRKSVINDNGGLSNATDWILSATGSSQIVSYLLGPSPVNSPYFFQADTYTLSESAGSGGYTPSQWSCVLNGNPPVLGSTITLGIGDEATCTISNDDKQGTIHLYKDVVAPDGKTDVSDNHTFTVMIDGVDYDISESSPADISLDSGTHTLTELPDSAYEYAGVWGVTDLDLLTEGIQFTTVPGQVITITLINKQTLGSISGQKYEDLNGNGVKDIGEKGLPGWIITLDKYADGTIDQSATTDADGKYSFTDLELAPYKVREIAQSGYSQTSVNPSDITLASGQTVENVDFGNMPLGSITVTKVDSQNSGTDFSFSFQKIGSQSSSFVLDDDNNQDGTYNDSIVFSDLVPARYDIVEKSVDNWTAETVRCDSNIDIPNPQNTFGYGEMSVALRPGEHLSCVFTNTRDTGTITLNKIWSGPGNQVTLNIGTSASGGQIASVQTGENGTDPLSTGAQTVNTGTYYVSETGNLTDFSSELDCVDNQTPMTPGTNNSIQVAKDHNVVCSFTNTRKTLPLYVTKFEDSNMDGLQGDGERALDGWTMELYTNASCFGEPIQTAVTSSDMFAGTARFSDLYQGVTYWVKEVEHTPDWVLTKANCQEYTMHDDLHSNNQMAFGNFHYAHVTGYKFEDVNNNGAYDDGEPYLNDWTIRLYKKALESDEWSFVGDSLTGSTGSTGAYGFEGLSLGDYKVCEVKQDGWNQTYPSGTSGGSNTEAPNCNFFTVTGSGQRFIADFGNVHFGTIIVSKYNDLDGDGTRDENEELLDNWEINLEGQPSQLTGSGDNETGKARFSKLVPGTYSLSETMQSGWEQTGISCKSSIGVKITAQGEAYGHHGYCSGWNGCGNAQTCAQWACEVKGYSTLVSYGDSRPCTQFNNCNLFYSRGNVQMNWGNWCDVMGVTDIVCSNGTTPTPTPTPTESPLTLLEKVSAQEGPSGYPVTLSAGDTMVCEIGNQYVPPELTIEKYNNRWPNSIGTGSDVSYTIVITAKNNKVYNVKVKDLLPKGFIYQKGSWSAHSSIHGALSLPEPTYASPGTWTLTADSGSNIYPYMQSGEVITLRFKANTDASLDPGVYKDIAWAAGTADISTDSDTVLASSQATDKNVDPGVVTDTFVGTKVQLDTTRHNSVSMNVIHEETREGEVLGASTELPATGANVLWLMIAAMSILSGIGCLYIDKRNRRLHA